MARDEKIPLRIHFLMLTGFVIAIFFVMLSTAIWRHNFREAFLFLAIGSGLAFLFFRKRLLILVGMILVCVFVLVGMGTISKAVSGRPSLPGILLTLGSGVCVYLLVRWDAKRPPHHGTGDWKSYFDNDSKR